MKNSTLFQISRSISIMAILVGLLSSCTTLVFEKPVPANGDVIRILPNFLEGTFIHQETSEYFEFERIAEDHCIINSYYGFPEDSVTKILEGIGIDRDSIEIIWSDNSYKINTGTVEAPFYFTLKDGIYFSEKSPIYEINLAKGYFVLDSKDKEENPIILKQDDKGFYINVLAESHWFLIRFRETQEGIGILKSEPISNDFSNIYSQYDTITPIKDIGGDTYLANPTDAQLYQLLNEPGLFAETTWVKVEEKKQSSPFKKATYYIIFGFIFVLFAVFYLERK